MAEKLIQFSSQFNQKMKVKFLAEMKKWVL